MAKHKYDPAVVAARKVAKEKVKTDVTKRTTVKEVADRLADIEAALGIR